MEHGSTRIPIGDLGSRRRKRFYGKYRGLVTNVDDPEQVGRILAQVPEILGLSGTTWATPCTPYPGAGEGWFVIPAVGAGVWIEFEAGDPSRPIWTGGWFGRGDVPRDEAGIVASPQLKLLRTSGALILALDDGGNTIALSDGNGNNLLKIRVNEGQVRVQAGTTVIVEAPHIELGEFAPHPLVLGDDLLQYLNQLVSLFNAHIHTGQTVTGVPISLTPPLPLFESTSSNMLSQKVKTQ